MILRKKVYFDSIDERTRIIVWPMLTQNVPGGRRTGTRREAKAITKLSREGWIVMESFEIRGCAASVCFFARWLQDFRWRIFFNGTATRPFRIIDLHCWGCDQIIMRKKEASLPASCFLFTEQSLFGERAVVKARTVCWKSANFFRISRNDDDTSSMQVFLIPLDFYQFCNSRGMLRIKKNQIITSYEI